VDLQAYDIRAELTATRRVGLHRYSFLRPAARRQPAMLFDLGYAIKGDEAVETQITLEGPRRSPGTGSRRVGQDQRVFFVARFSTPIRRGCLARSRAPRASAGGEGEAGARPVPLRAAPGAALNVKVAISPVSVEGARRSLERETPGWEFDGYGATPPRRGSGSCSGPDRDARPGAQDGLLHRALPRAPGADELQRQRRELPGVERRGPAAGGVPEPHGVSALAHVPALHPLMTLVQAERVDDLVQSLMAAYRETGRLPAWPLWATRPGR